MNNQLYDMENEELMAKSFVNLGPIAQDNIVAAFAVNDLLKDTTTFMVLAKYQDLHGNNIADVISITDSFWVEGLFIDKIKNKDKTEGANFEVGSLYHIVKDGDNLQISPTHYNRTIKQRYCNILDYSNIYFNLAEQIRNDEEYLEVNAGLVNSSQALINIIREMQFVSDKPKKEINESVKNIKKELEKGRYDEAEKFGLLFALQDTFHLVNDAFNNNKIKRIKKQDEVITNKAEVAQM